MLSTSEKKKVVRKHARFGGDTGSAEVQIALLTANINSLQKHFEDHKKDHAGRKGLIGMVNLRRKLLRYLKRRNLESYAGLIKQLKIRG
jgi:small subunit ribosomal protein S15